MNVEIQCRKARALLDMHRQPAPLLLPNAWDAISACLFERAGFGAIATTSAGVAWSLGHADGESLTRDEMIAAIARIARCVSVPVTADIEAGYGDMPAQIEETIEQVIHAGAVGINLEDSSPEAGGHRICDIEVATGRLRAARAVAQRCGIPIVINARTDLYLIGAGTPQSRFDDTVQRARAYLEAGADCIYPIGVVDAPTIAALVKAIPAPVNVIGKPAGLTLAALAELGVARVSSAVTPVLAMMSAVQCMASELQQTGSFAAMASDLTHAQVQQMFAGQR